MASAGPKVQSANGDLPDAGRDTDRHGGSDALLNCEGEVVEVLGGFGLAHLRTTNGALFGINRETPGVDFAAIRVGQRFRIVASTRFNRVVRAEVLEPDE